MGKKCFLLKLRKTVVITNQKDNFIYLVSAGNSVRIKKTNLIKLINFLGRNIDAFVNILITYVKFTVFLIGFLSLIDISLII
jgi:hypothetical protein